MADENSTAEPFHLVAKVDLERLLKSLKSHCPEALTVGNSPANLGFVDVRGPSLTDFIFR